VAPVLRVCEHAFDGRHVTRQLVSDHHSRLKTGFGIQHAVQEALCGVLVPPTLNKDIEHRPIMIYGTPQPVPAFVHRERTSSRYHSHGLPPINLNVRPAMHLCGF
jgi:hypothetical protein